MSDTESPAEAAGAAAKPVGRAPPDATAESLGGGGVGGGGGGGGEVDLICREEIEICRDEVELLLRPLATGDGGNGPPSALRAGALGRVRAALRLDAALDAAAARLGVHKGALLKSLLEAPPQCRPSALGGGGGGGGGGGAAAEPSVEAEAEGRCGMEAAEWREMQVAALEMVERGTYAHKVLRYKYQDVADMRMAREMLQRCEAFLARNP